MSKAVIIEGAWVEVGDEPLDVGGINFRADWLEGQTPEDLAELGITCGEIAETDPPAGAKILGSHLVDAGGVPTRAWDVDTFDAGELAALKAGKIAEIHAEATRRVAAILPERAQRRAMAKGLAGIFQHGADATAWPDDLRAELAAVLAAWGRIEDVELAEDNLVAAMPADAAGIAAISVSDNPAWPA